LRELKRFLQAAGIVEGEDLWGSGEPEVMNISRQSTSFSGVI
jgi:hypothetical protein